MAGTRRQISRAGKRHDRLLRLQWIGFALGLSGAIASALLSPLAGDAVLAFFLATVIALLAHRAGPGLAVLAVPAAIAAYRGSLDLAWRDQTSVPLTIAIVALFAGTALGVTALRILRREEPSLRKSPIPANCVSYESFALVLSKDLARAQRYKGVGSLALLYVRNLDELLKPDAYQQHELIVSRALSEISANLRNSDTACYLGQLHFAIVFPHVNSQQAWIAIERLKGVVGQLPQKVCPALYRGPIQWQAVCLEYPQDGASASDLLAAAGRTLGEPAQLRIDDLERQRVAVQRQMRKLGCA